MSKNEANKLQETGGKKNVSFFTAKYYTSIHICTMYRISQGYTEATAFIPTSKYSPFKQWLF